MDHKQILKDLISRRKVYLDIYYSSYDENTLDYTIDEPEEIDMLGIEIRSHIEIHRSKISVEDIIESLTMLGDSPSLLYDDNGNFAVVSDGFQKTAPDDMLTMLFNIEKDCWKPTIREALEYYLKTN